MGDDQGIFHEVSEYIRVSKDVIDLAKAGLALWPKGPKREEGEQRIKAAEESLMRADAALAKSLGYPLCKCTFPPQIMLWSGKERAFVCPNKECQTKIEPRKSSQASHRSGWLE